MLKQKFVRKQTKYKFQWIRFTNALIDFFQLLMQMLAEGNAYQRLSITINVTYA